MVCSLYIIYSVLTSVEVKAARAHEIREQWVKVMQARLLRDELSKCQKAEGVNSYENCRVFVDKYLDALKTGKVSKLTPLLIIMTRSPVGHWLADNRSRIESRHLIVILTMYSPIKRILNAFFPILLLSVVAVNGFIPALKYQLSNPSILNWISPRKWWSLLFSSGFPAVLEGADKAWGPVKSGLIKHANGQILEIGPGAGHTIKYYDVEKVQRIVGIEPYLPLHKLARKAIEKNHLSDKYNLVAASIEDYKVLAEHGVHPESMDTIVCIQVLCSIPNPKEVIASIYKYLKPGGQLILFEHVKSQGSITSFLQTFWTSKLGWNAITGESSIMDLASFEVSN